MTGTVIAPVAIPSTSARDRRSPLAAASKPLPLPDIPAPRTSTVAYGLSALDCHGRIADRTVFSALGWEPGTRLAVNVTHATAVIVADPNGTLAMTGHGDLRLPAPVRHRCSLATGDRVLLAAHPDRGVLLAHPPAQLDRLLADAHPTLLDGDPA
ncbi:AbrB/MazE/SpoVT family DNA-binding domain-containing protein [Amycolatopsis rubida]|uniref:AbrB/MazE/SpoVT family DNA-binding domain-containing protein n=1 Tax=Amycolatopsis rubida TaxID=112413 RepID=A0A1I6BA11_9PSEU|nr:AbrB/MazE/SpoVT family DNA-binding domain-containing protein [Amycolatopsis rubida]SFQ77776.1 hypothetical protein SAMN05421854_12484 [Amycolatopsis rubida]